MAEVFISYKSERRRAAEHLAAVLERYGYSVWFDYQLIKGRDFGLQIDRMVREAKALIVLWCAMSVKSRWVAEEVDLAHELGILIPVKIEPCTLSVGFRRQDYIDLSAWDGSPTSHYLYPLFDALEQKIGRPPAPDYKALRDYEATWRRFGALPLKSFAFDQPRDAHEGDRGLPDRAGAPTAHAESSSDGDQPTRLALAAREWPAVRESADPRRLLRFEQHFAGTYYAEEARELRDMFAARAREAEAKQQAERERAAKEQAEAVRRKAEGLIQVRIGDGQNDEVRWFRPGSGERFKDLPFVPEMVVVPAGEFMMGSPESDRDAYSDEKPQHKVTIAEHFAVGVAPVTRGEFAAFVNATSHKIEGGARVWNGKEWVDDPTKSWRDPGFRQMDDHPVVCVSWNDAQAYAAWLRERSSGKAYRLLSEAEWEYCCRAGTSSRYSTGDAIAPEQANFGQNAKGTTSVAKFAPNPWGLRDAHGNVWEWCEDNWHKDYKDDPPSNGSVWRGGDASLRVLRGGSWFDVPQILRSACRIRDQPVNRGDLVGFRVARTL